MKATRGCSHPVAFFINGIGDCILNLPALRALAALHQGELTLVSADAPQSHVFDELPLRRAVRIPATTTPRGKTFDHQAAARAIGPCDLFVSLVPWHNEDLDGLLRELPPRRSIGFAPAFDVALPLDFGKHTSRLAFDAVRVLWPDAPFECFLGPPAFGESARGLVAELRTLLPPGAKYLTVHGDTHPEKMWPRERFQAVLARFLEAHPEYFCFVVGSLEQDLAVATNEERIISVVGLPLAASQCLVAGADLFLGVDSCHLHVADFAGVPSVGLFGPTHAHEFGFLVAPHRALQARRGMQEISVDDVGQALESLASSPRGAHQVRGSAAAGVAAP